ncbi:MAG TPA: septal ring lytic transglycosylase RlpA family protein [Solirubrobacteraceae bacterium]|nr:septal ring lytic transglycosylase RlpA family protein [Solirubrobacteraceae bacterium]
MSRPYIVGRVRRAQPVLLGASLTCAAILTVVPAAGAEGASVASLPTAPANSAGAAVPPLFGPVVLPAHPVRVKLHIRRAQLNVLDGSAASVTGGLRPGLVKRVVELQRLGRQGWETISHTLTGRGGRFVLRYLPHRLLSEPVRVRFVGDVGDLGAHRGVGRLTSYRLADASWYGGGGSLACGGELTSSTLGVANKTLPCGTLVTLRYGGHTVRVPVVDRGPYVEGREFDLTEATKRELGFEGVGEVWSNR